MAAWGINCIQCTMLHVNNTRSETRPGYVWTVFRCFLMLAGVLHACTQTSIWPEQRVSMLACLADIPAYTHHPILVNNNIHRHVMHASICHWQSTAHAASLKRPTTVVALIDNAALVIAGICGCPGLLSLYTRPQLKQTVPLSISTHKNSRTSRVVRSR